MIEVNTNPCLEESSALLSELIPRMIDDALKLTVDLIFASKKPKILMNKIVEVAREVESLEIIIGSEPGNNI